MVSERSGTLASDYPGRKARMERDAEFRHRVLSTQAESRRRRRAEEWQIHIERYGDTICLHQYPNGRRCWKVEDHNHAE